MALPHHLLAPPSRQDLSALYVLDTTLPPPPLPHPTLSLSSLLPSGMGVIFLDEPKNIRVSSNQNCAKVQESVFNAGVPRDKGAIAVLVSATSFNDQRNGKRALPFDTRLLTVALTRSQRSQLVDRREPSMSIILNQPFRPSDHVVFSFGRSSAHACSAWSNTVYDQNTYLNDVLLTQEGEAAGASYHGETAMQPPCGKKHLFLVAAARYSN